MEKIRFRNKYSYTKLLLVMFGYPRLELAHFLGLADNDVLSEVEDLRIVGAEKGGDGHFQRHRVVRQHELHKTHVRARFLPLRACAAWPSSWRVADSSMPPRGSAAPSFRRFLFPAP